MKDIRGRPIGSIGFFSVKQRLFSVSKPSERRSNGDDVQGGLGNGGEAKGGNWSSPMVGLSYPLKFVSLATLVMDASASDSFSFPEIDPLYTLYWNRAIE